MHRDHVTNLITLHANLSRALTDGERVKLGGGVFYAPELSTLLLAVSSSICAAYENGNETQRGALSDVVRRIRGKGWHEGMGSVDWTSAP